MKEYGIIKPREMTNKKDDKIKKLWDRGVQDITILARKLGYTGNATTAGIGRVKEALMRLNLMDKQ